LIQKILIMPRILIYQVFPRYFGNTCSNRIPNGTLEENGCGKFQDFNAEALKSICDMGYTHLWLTGVLEHATRTDYSKIGIERDHPAVVKGYAGSPYAVKDYYDVDPDLAVDPMHRMDEFKELLARCREAGLQVLIDFIPNHVARQYHSDACPAGTRDFGADDVKEEAFNPDNNFYYLPDQALMLNIDLYAGYDTPYSEFPAKATGNDCFSANPGPQDWYETAKLNYGVDYQNNGVAYFHTVPGTWFKMLDILTFWTKIGVDGFRCDMAEMVPVEFWAWVIPRIKELRPSVLFIAEVYQPGRYWDYLHRGKFDYLYDKEGLYNTLRAVTRGQAPASDITHCWQAVGYLQAQMLYFLENHDEQRIASSFFAGDPRIAFPAMTVLACMSTNPIMVYAGQELGESGMYAEGFSGQDGRSTIFDYWSLESLVAWNNNGQWNEDLLSEDQKQVRLFYNRLLFLCSHEKALEKGSFFDLMYANGDHAGFNSFSVYAFLRKYETDCLLVLSNFSGEPQQVQLYVPNHAFECLDVPIGRDMHLTDLLSGQTKDIISSSTQPFCVDLLPYSSAIFKGSCL
jgi:glycosidase